MNPEAGLAIRSPAVTAGPGPGGEGQDCDEHRVVWLAEIASARESELAADIKRLVKSGRADEALARLEQERADLRSPDLLRLRTRLTRAIRALRTLAPERLARGEDTSLIALGCVLRRLADRRSAPPSTSRLAGVALITGHLGAGGAELQMTRTAEMLTVAASAKQAVAGVRIAGPVHVVVKSMSPEADRVLNFHHSKLARKNIPVWQMDGMAPVEPQDVTDDEEIAALLPLLHPNIQRGLCLVPWFRQHKISVAYIWQDNPILYTAIAAMLAGVPRLVLNFRGLPPVLRWKAHLSEYKELYSALMEAPGVTLVTNSAAAADAYSDWIECPRRLFHVMMNGSSHHAPHPGDHELKTWSKFDARTKDASITIGGIFRMHPNKRPMEWVRFARRYLDTHPRARFIMIGSGIFFDAMKDLVSVLGLSDRLLMVRQTQAGEFWLKKMDVFVLLSRYEGTPNVLIEAQLAGVPVVCTPVANANDTFVEGITGLATASTDFVDVEDVVAKVDRIVTYARSSDAVRRYAQRHVETRFSTRSMIEHTVRLLAGREEHCCARPLAPFSAAPLVPLLGSCDVHLDYVVVQ